jgi:hypothetical protein
VQVDESTDIAGPSVLLAFVSYNQVEEETLKCKPLPAHTTGENIFNLIDL